METDIAGIFTKGVATLIEGSFKLGHVNASCIPDCFFFLGAGVIINKSIGTPSTKNHAQFPKPFLHIVQRMPVKIIVIIILAITVYIIKFPISKMIWRTEKIKYIIAGPQTDLCDIYIIRGKKGKIRHIIYID